MRTLNAEDRSIIAYNVERVLPLSAVGNGFFVGDKKESVLRLEPKERRNLFEKTLPQWNRILEKTRRDIGKLVTKITNDSLDSLDVFAIVDTCLLHNITPDDILTHLPNLVALCYQLQDIEVAIRILKTKLRGQEEVNDAEPQPTRA